MAYFYYMAAKLYLIPIPIAEDGLHTLSEEIKTITAKLQYYFVENARTARRFIKSLHPDMVIEPVQFCEIDKHSGPDMQTFTNWLNKGYSIGVMSEAGCPGIADPGSVLVKRAHQLNATVIPLTGPNSIVLALMASGLNGQSFCFNGYLPLKDPARSTKIKDLEALSAKEKQTQIFIETPYRNNSVFEELLRHCKNNTLLCVAQNITSPDAFIKTRTMYDWKQNKPDLAKQPAVFLILA